MKHIQKIAPHLLAIVAFIAVALVYFYPVLQGKKIYQSDIIQYTAMAKEQNDFRLNEKSEPYWTNSAFGGMPTYQLGAKYPNNFIKTIDETLRFLPRPADYLFLYFIGFYVLLLILKIDPLKAFFGALAFGFSTYLIIILGVGHNAKAHAIAYMPLIIAGSLLVFRKKYIVGGLLTSFALALELNANHPQMTYYLLFLLLFLAVYYSYKFIKSKEYTAFLKTIGTFLLALMLALGVNATSILATKEYAAFSTRGKSDLKLNADGSKKEGSSTLEREYITQYSYGIAESLNLIAPRLFGGSNSEPLPKDSEIVAYLKTQQVSDSEYMSEDQAIQYAQEGMPTYWGNQPGVSAPAYIGAVVFFLFVLSLYNDKRKIKYVFLAGAVLSLILSWGKNLAFVTDFFIDFVPMYDKFRAVSSVQVILELCVPVIALLGLQSFFESDKNEQYLNLKKAAITSFGILILLLICRGMFDFAGANDAAYIKNYGLEFMNALKADRKSLYSADLLRSGFFILLASGALFLYIKNKFSIKTTVVLVGLFMVADLFFVAKKYVSAKDFVSANEVDVPYQSTPIDDAILRDKSSFRVFEIEGDLMNSRSSYFHKSIGGYSAVKPRKMQELFDYQIANNNLEMLNLLNVKYIISKSNENKDTVIVNPSNNGNAWFIKQLRFVATADEEMKMLKGLDSKNGAICTKSQENESLFNKISATKDVVFQKEAGAVIKLISEKSNYLQYQSSNKYNGVAVFSEIYYKNGWNAYIDGKLSPHFKVDYTFRALQIPAGNHQVIFKFEPQVIKTGSTTALVSFVLLMILLIFGIYFETKKGFDVE